MTNEQRDAEIGRLMLSIERMDDADEDEVDPDHYSKTLARLVYLRHERDEAAAARPVAGKAEEK